jgi:HD-like signal output (HDOD) protein
MKDSLFWLVSARRACLARHIALLLHPATQSESFTAALLQDMAIPLISNIKNQSYKELLDRWHMEKEANIDEMERDLFGYDHPSVGALLAEEWSLPEFLINSIAGHHNLSEQSAVEPAVRLVSLIRYFDEDDGTERLLETAQADFGIDKHVLEEMITKAFDEAEQFAATFK